MDHGELDLGKMEEEEGHLYLPPGFRFHPTDEELITYYLSKKVMNPSGFTTKAMGDVDLNKCEPWDLPWKAKMGEKEWYFFCVRDRKYPTGLRTNRATEAGYWKATGKDKEIYRGKSLVGMKKTLVFYKGRAPKGEKTSWVMHEYRSEEKNSVFNHSKSANREWVISRVFNKSACVKKPMGTSLLPPLMDVPSTSKNMAHVTCFSNAMEGQKGHDDILAEYYNYSTPFLTSISAAATKTSVVSPSSLVLGKMPLQNTFYGASSMGHTPASLVQLLQSSNGYNMNQSRKMEREMLSVSQDTGITSDINPEISSVVSNNEMGRHSFDRQEDPSPSAGQLQLHQALWNY